VAAFGLMRTIRIVAVIHYNSPSALEIAESLGQNRSARLRLLRRVVRIAVTPSTPK
jgi:hypothetical protein